MSVCVGTWVGGRVCVCVWVGVAGCECVCVGKWVGVYVSRRFCELLV